MVRDLEPPLDATVTKQSAPDRRRRRRRRRRASNQMNSETEREYDGMVMHFMVGHTGF